MYIVTVSWTSFIQIFNSNTATSVLLLLPYFRTQNYSVTRNRSGAHNRSGTHNRSSAHNRSGSHNRSTAHNRSSAHNRSRAWNHSGSWYKLAQILAVAHGTAVARWTILAFKNPQYLTELSGAKPQWHREPQWQMCFISSNSISEKDFKTILNPCYLKIQLHTFRYGYITL